MQALIQMLLFSIVTSTAVASPGVPRSADVLWEEYLSHFESSETQLHEDGVACGTILVANIKENWADFTEDQRAQITQRLTPWKDDLLAPMKERELPPPPMEKDTCWGQQAANRVTTEHFAVEWDAGIDEETAQAFADALEHSWTEEFDTLGWLEPTGSSSRLIWVFVDNANYGGAYTTIDLCGSIYMPYIVTGKDVFDWGSWFESMAAHELNHASQFAYSWTMDQWYYEATATYVQEDVFPEYSDWIPYIRGYSDNPWIALDAANGSMDEQAHMYGMALLNFYLDEHVDGESMVREIWDYARKQGYQNVKFIDALEELGYSWDEILQGFLVANTVMDYDDQRFLAGIDKEDKISELPADGESDSRTEPEGYGQNFIQIVADLETSDRHDLVVNFEGEDTADWMVLLVGVIDEEVVSVSRMEVDESDVTLESYELLDEAWLIVVPMRDSSRSHEYSWSMEAVYVPPPEPVDTGEETDVLEDSSRVGAACEGLGCAVSSPAGVGVFSVLGLFALARRRES